MRYGKRASRLFIFSVGILALVFAQTLTAAERQLVVAASGGDYTTIQDALAAIDPTVSDPYVIDVMPGKYVLNQVVMKSNVHLRGAGSNVTYIYAPSYPSRTALLGDNLKNVRITGFHFYNGIIGQANNAGFGIEFNDGDNVTISDNKFEGLNAGITFRGTGKLTIEDNLFISGGNQVRYGGANAYINNNEFTGSISNAINGIGPAMISGNYIHDLNGVQATGISIPAWPDTPISIIGNTIRNAGRGIYCRFSDDITIQGNTIMNNGGYGIYLNYATALILHNQITGNGTAGNSSFGLTDIGLSRSQFRASFNVYDSIVGTGTFKGNYNLTSDGEPAPVF